MQHKSTRFGHAFDKCKQDRQLLEHNLLSAIFAKAQVAPGSAYARTGNMNGNAQMITTRALHNRDDIASVALDAIESLPGNGSTDTFGRLGTPSGVLLAIASRTPYARIHMASWTARVCNPGLAAAYALRWRSLQRCHAAEQPIDGFVHGLPDCKCCGMGTGSFCDHCCMPLCTRCSEAFDDCCLACRGKDAKLGARMLSDIS